MYFEHVEKNYVRGLWNEKMVGKAVEKGVITAEEYLEITGNEFTGVYTSKEKTELEACAELYETLLTLMPV